MSENINPTQSELGSKRARDADREKVMGLLDGALADGQLDGFEHGDRVAKALRAATLGELGATLTDLQVPTPTFLRPPAPITAERPVPAVPRQQVPAITERPSPAEQTSGSRTDQAARTIASILAAVAIGVVVIAIATSSTKDTEQDSNPFGGKAYVTTCDGEGRNCKDGNGRSVPDLPRDKPTIDGVTLVGNPMASSNVRKTYESMISALAPTSVVELNIDKWSANAVVKRTDDPQNTQKWTLSGGAWKYNTYWGNQGQNGTEFAPAAMNLDRITAAIADAPGIQRSEREPTSVVFTATKVTIIYSGTNGTSAMLILTPDGTVVE